jgi:hypothetical protein
MVHKTDPHRDPTLAVLGCPGCGLSLEFKATQTFSSELLVPADMLVRRKR